jgi:Domain of unknown function (DUF4126)
MNPLELSPYLLAAAVAWASGLRLYVVLLLLGVAGHFQWLSLPKDLEVLQHPWVMVATSTLVFLEFFADKIPGVDSVWDAIHTFVRIPAGALLAAGIIAPQDGAAWALAAGLLGGTITAGTHFAKTGGRALINTSPEPFSNWGASLAEDGLVLTGIWLLVSHPFLFLALLVTFIGLIVWLLPKLWRGLRAVLRRLQKPFSQSPLSA